jgi:hypothetical protein
MKQSIFGIKMPKREVMAAVCRNIAGTALFMIMNTTLHGCDGGKSTASAGGEAVWLDAPDEYNKNGVAAEIRAVDVYKKDGVAAEIRALDTPSGSPERTCEVIVHKVRESLMSHNAELAGIDAPCNKVGLEFAAAVRCRSGRMQVKCQQQEAP